MHWTKQLPSNRPFSMRSMTFPSTLRVLMVGPHPDDFDAIGITMRFFQQNGNPIHVITIRAGSGIQNSFCSPPTFEAKAALRDDEQQASCRFFGLPDECLTLLDLEQSDDARILHTQTNLDRLRDLILQQRPDLAFMPHGNDTNHDHRLVYTMFKQIVTKERLPVTAFLIRDPKTTDMRIDCYTEFDEAEANWKGQLLRFHASQHQRNLNTRNHGFDDRILLINKDIARGLDLSQPYAEAFELEFHNVETGTTSGSSVSVDQRM